MRARPKIGIMGGLWNGEEKDSNSVISLVSANQPTVDSFHQKVLSQTSQIEKMSQSNLFPSYSKYGNGAIALNFDKNSSFFNKRGRNNAVQFNTTT